MKARNPGWQEDIRAFFYYGYFICGEEVGMLLPRDRYPEIEFLAFQDRAEEIAREWHSERTYIDEHYGNLNKYYEGIR